jgi:hypothetical protein
MKLFPIHLQVLALLNSEGILLGEKERAVNCLSECVSKSKALWAYEDMMSSINNTYIPVKREYLGRILYSVECGDYTLKYCNDYNSASLEADRMNEYAEDTGTLYREEK